VGLRAAGTAATRINVTQGGGEGDRQGRVIGVEGGVKEGGRVRGSGLCLCGVVGVGGYVRWGRCCCSCGKHTVTAPKRQGAPSLTLQLLQQLHVTTNLVEASQIETP